MDSLKHAVSGFRDQGFCFANDYSSSLSDIVEECDSFGFSLLQTENGAVLGVNRESRTGKSLQNESKLSPISRNVVKKFQSDSNWNNPESVALMCRAYHMTDMYSLNSCFLEDEKRLSRKSYLDIRAEQHKMFARRLLQEGLLYKEKGAVKESFRKFTEAIRYDPSSITAFLERAISHVQMKQFDQAIDDFSTVLRMDPGHELALQQYNLLSACHQTNVGPTFTSADSYNLRDSVYNKEGGATVMPKMDSIPENQMLVLTPSTSSNGSVSSDSASTSTERKHKKRKREHKKKKSKHKKSSKKDDKKKKKKKSHRSEAD
jgi:tetratricopeptide (TPR) repeat protein